MPLVPWWWPYDKVGQHPHPVKCSSADTQPYNAGFSSLRYVLAPAVLINIFPVPLQKRKDFSSWPHTAPLGLMSYSYDRVERQRRTTYGSSTRRSAWGYWIPLAVTVTVATAGLAAWVWSERKDHDDDEDDYYDKKAGRRPPPDYRELGPGGVPYHPQGASGQTQDESFITRMSGAIRRTPSPQQIYDSASKRVVAGMTAAGAVVGGALSSIREEDRRDFEDHSRWSEEAETRATTATASALPDQRALAATMSTRQGSQNGSKTGAKRKTVAVVVSADIGDHDHSQEVPYMQEHAVSLYVFSKSSLLTILVVHPITSPCTH